MKLRGILLATASFICVQLMIAQVDNPPVRIGVDGLSHDHIHGLLRKHNERKDISIVGVAEANPELVEKYVKMYGLDRGIIFPDLETMILKTKPEGVVAFNSIYEHLKTVEICAPHGVHVMVEKPLAVNSKHALKMAQLAKRHKIHILTNYETTWYPTHYKAYEIAVATSQIGEINKIVVHDGHKGPVEIGCSKEFLAWLTDPVLNGGGAVIDFGCYGANLTTWLMKNEEPVSVTAILQQIKPEVYPKVDDMATIILTYPHAQAILQGSWNWPVDRKDIDIYGKAGYVRAFNDTNLEYRLKREVPKEELKVTEFPTEAREPFGYFGHVIRGDWQVKPADLSSLENNLIVVKILDAARLSAKKGKTITFNLK